MAKVYDLLVRARGETSDAQAALKELQGVVAATGKKMRTVGRNMTLGVTLPVVAAGAASFKAFANFDQTMRQVGAVVSDSAGQMDKMRDTALKLGADTSFSAQQVATAMLELGKGGITQAQMSAGVLQETLTLAAAGGLELGSAAAYMSNTLNAFGLNAKSAGGVAAALAGGATASTASVESLGLGLSQVSAQAKVAGMGMNETIAALAAFDQAGVKGSDAGTSLKTMLQRLTPQTEKAADMMKKLGIDFTDAQGNFKPMSEVAQELQDGLKTLGSESERSAALTTMFGSDASRAAAILGSVGAEGIGKYTAATKDLSAAKELAKTNTEGASGSIEQMMGSIETLAITMGGLLAPTVISIAGKIADLARWMSSLPQPIQQTILVTAALAAALGPVLMAVGQMTIGISAMIPLIVKMGSAISVATAMNPALVAMGIAVGVVAATIGLLMAKEGQKEQKFRQGAAAARDQAAALGSLKDSQERLAGAQLGAKEASVALQQAIVARDQAEATHGKNSLEYRAAVLGVSRAWLSKKDAIDAAAAAEDKEAATRSKAVSNATASMSMLKEEGILRERLAREDAAAMGARSQAERVTLSARAASTARHLKTMESGHKENLEAVNTAYKNGWITREDVVRNGLTVEKGIVRAAAPGMKAAGKTVGKAAVDGARAGTDGGYGVGQNLAKGMSRGIASLVSEVASSARKLVDGAIDAANKAADSHSPSRRFAREVGEPIGQGIAVGITSSGPEVMAAVKDVVSSAALGFAGTKWGAFGNLSNAAKPTGAKGLADVLRYVSASSGQAYSTTQNADGTASVSENTDVTAFLKFRKAQAEARLKSLLAARKTSLGKLKMAREALTVADAAYGRAKRAGDKKKKASTLKTLRLKRDAVGTLEGVIEGYEQEILQLGGQIQADTEALTPPDVSEQNAADASSDERAAENLRREALGLQSLDEEERLAAINRIRVANGLQPVSSTSEIGATATTAPVADPALVQGSIGGQGLLPSSASAAAAVRDAALRALNGSGTNINVYPTSGDPEAIAQRVAMILGSSRLRAGGAF